MVPVKGDAAPFNDDSAGEEPGLNVSDSDDGFASVTGHAGRSCTPVGLSNEPGSPLLTSLRSNQPTRVADAKPDGGIKSTLSSQSIHTEPARALVSAIIERAIIDYKQLVRAGYVVAMKQVKPVVPPIGVRIASWIVTDAQIQKTLHFFTSDTLQDWLDLGAINMTQSAMVEMLKAIKPSDIRGSLS